MGRPRDKRDDDVLVAVQSGTVEIDGVPHPVQRDRTRVARGSAVYRAAPHLFKEMDAHYGVEQATKWPGEKRGNAA